MVFGSVAMSFRGTSFKIHSFSAPPKLMCTQVFPSPKASVRSRVSVSNSIFPLQQSSSSMQSLEKSAKLDYSSASSTTSFTEQTTQNNDFDIKIVPCSTSIPLDVPKSSLETDSGFFISSSSNGSNPQSVTPLDGRLEHLNGPGLSCGSLYKRWLRSASTSLEHSFEEGPLGQCSASADECMIRSNHRTSKLGLAVIVELSEHQESEMESFLLKHAALIEAMVTRARSCAESAYIRPGCFASLMYDIYQETTRWLTDLLTGPSLNTYFWHTLSLHINTSLLDFTKRKETTKPLDKSLNLPAKNNSPDFTKTRSEGSLVKMERFFGHFETSKRDRTDRQSLESLSGSKSLQADSFIRELCELLESVDVKHTNFFISTLLTAVLTNHLGWVSTVSPPSQIDKDLISKLSAPCNPLWGQLTDLYGAVGYPTKMSRTIVCGNNKGDLITRILNMLTYFIRCSSVEKNNLSEFLVGDFEQKEEVKMSEKISNRFKEIHQKKEEIEMSVIGCDNSLLTAKTLRKNKSYVGGLCLQNPNLTNNNKTIKRKPDEDGVVFVLGDDDQLIGLKKSLKLDLNIPCSSFQRPTKVFSSSDSSPDCLGPCADLSPCSECEKVRKRSSSLQPGTSKEEQVKLCSKEVPEVDLCETRRREGFDRSQSVPPSDKSKKCSKNGCKKKYSGVKFDIRQYPQIVTNYMKSKDLELSQLPFGEKSFKLNRSFSTTLYDSCAKFDFPSCDCEPHDSEALQTPSNASELEFTSDLDTEKYEPKKEPTYSEIVEHPLQVPPDSENNAIFEHDIDSYEKKEVRTQMVFTELKLPKIDTTKSSVTSPSMGYTRSLLRGVGQKYISDMVLQGTTASPRLWEQTLKRDLSLTARQPLLDQPIQEAVAIVANTDTWEVQLVSSHSYVVEKDCTGVRVCLSQLVANMLESLLHMWKLRTPSEYCLMHIESRLREFCMQSRALARLLMTTEFCNMEVLTSSMQLEVNDVPLLMAVASTHTPQVTRKYGLSFQ